VRLWVAGCGGVVDALCARARTPVGHPIDCLFRDQVRFVAPDFEMRVRLIRFEVGGQEPAALNLVGGVVL
jgi:hypothetical protein